MTWLQTHFEVDQVELAVRAATLANDFLGIRPDALRRFF
jgi:hypothetical protein